MLWIKSLHIVFVAGWFAGLFYLPRLFVNLALVPAGSTAERERLLEMSRKLLQFTTLISIPALVFGLALWRAFGIGHGTGFDWLGAKLVVVAAILAYHVACAVLLQRLEEGRDSHSHSWFRWFNEVPLVLLLGAVVLVVHKPF